MKRFNIAALAAVVVLAAVPVLSAHAMENTMQFTDDAWHGEIMPYVWSTGVWGTLCAEQHCVSVKKSFSDLWDYTNFGGSLYGAAYKGHFTTYGQIDYFSLSKANFNNAPPGTSASMKVYIYTVGVGYRMNASKGRHYDFMLGLRTVSLNSIDLTIPGVINSSNSRNSTDALLIFRPYFPFSEKWSFSPTMDIGGGQAQLTYEVWPQVRFQFAEHWAMRFGYRRLYYRITNGNNVVQWYGSFEGLTLGVGGTW